MYLIISDILSQFLPCKRQKPHFPILQAPLFPNLNFFLLGRIICNFCEFFHFQNLNLTAEKGETGVMRKLDYTSGRDQVRISETVVPIHNNRVLKSGTIKKIIA